MNSAPKSIIYPVSDIEKAKNLFGNLLGIKPYVESDFYVGFRTGEVEVGLDPNGHKDGVTPYFDVEDIDASLEGLKNDGAEVIQEPKEVGGGLVTAIAKDADGNIIGLRQQKDQPEN